MQAPLRPWGVGQLDRQRDVAGNLRATPRWLWHCSLTSLAAIAIGIGGCKPVASSHDSEKKPPAKVEKLPHESELSTLTLTEVAEKHLAISTAVVVEREASLTRTLGGEVMIPTGKAIIVSAPLAGTVERTSDRPLPQPGSRVTAGQAMLTLLPLLSAERDVLTPAEQFQVANARATLIGAQLTAQGDLDRSRAEVDAAKIAVARAGKLLSDRAGSQRAVDDAQGLLNVAQSVYAAAEQRSSQLGELIKTLPANDERRKAGEPLHLVTPVTGIVRSLTVSQGQAVSSAAPLFEVIDDSVMWVRVPVYVDLLASLNLNKTARVLRLDGRDPDVPSQARAIAAPPTADPLSSSADLYFEIDNRQTGLRPGQRIGLELTVGETELARIVPAASVLFDIQGGAWVYVVSEPHKYVRQRIQLRRIEGDEAILATGPKVGASVVVDGAAELFGTEFGIGK